MIRASLRVFEAGLVRLMQLPTVLGRVVCLNALGDNDVASTLTPSEVRMTFPGTL
jgi:hypothetical protein